MKNKYFNDAISGGKGITASCSNNGELLRMMYDAPDFRQYLDFFYTGVKVNDWWMIYLHEDQNNRYNQYYTQDTNILNTEIENTYFNMKVKQTDFVSVKNSVLVKRYFALLPPRCAFSLYVSIRFCDIEFLLLKYFNTNPELSFWRLMHIL